MTDVFDVNPEQYRHTAIHIRTLIAAAINIDSKMYASGIFPNIQYAFQNMLVIVSTKYPFIIFERILKTLKSRIAMLNAYNINMTAARRPIE
jgi:hypothetical protein